MIAPGPPGRVRVETKSTVSPLVIGLDDEIGQLLLLSERGRAYNPTAALYLYEQSSAVSIPVNWVAEAFSSVPLSLMLNTSKGPEVIKDHDVLGALRQPSAWHDGELFIDILAKDYLITGECHFVALGNINMNRPPLELVPISPRSITPSPEIYSDAPVGWNVLGNTLTGFYELELKGKQARYLQGNYRELHTTRNYSTRNNSMFRGQSPLVPAAREVRSHILGTEHNVSLLENGGRVSLVFHFDTNMKRADFEETRRRIIEQYGGWNRAGSIGVTSGQGMKIEELGTAPKDMDYKGVHQVAKESVAMTYRVPLPLISTVNMTLSNYKEAKTALYDDAVIPLASRILGSLSRFLLPRYGLDPEKARICINPDDIPALVSRRNDELGKRAKLNIETDNELRGMIGREPYEGGDQVYKPATLIPVGSDLFTEDLPRKGRSAEREIDDVDDEEQQQEDDERNAG